MNFLNYWQAAELLNIKIGTLYALVSRKRIPHVRLGGRLVRFSRDDLEAWVREHSVAVAPSDERRVAQ